MLPELFRSAVVNHRSKAAVTDNARSVTYGELHDAALDFGAVLRRQGARPGDRVAVKLPNGADAAIALWGTLEAGCVMVPLPAGLRGEALRVTLEDADPHWLVQQPGQAVQRAATSTEDSTALAALLYTSGSTGEPKGVMLSHGNMTAAVWMVNDYLGLASSDVIHSALPLSSSYGLYQLLLGLTVGATVLLDRGFAFPASCLSFAAQERATVMAAVPAMLGWMAGTPLLDQHDLSSLRMITSAAAALPPAHSTKLRERLPGVRLFVMYGQTECKRISWLDPADLPRHADSVGRGLAGQQHRVITDDGADAAPGELGELIVRGPHVMQGYWRKPLETAAKLRAAADGALPWMHTGDTFSIDEEGFLYFAGRRDEILKIGGNKVSPAQIENLLCQIPGVLEAAVTGTPDPQWGHVAVAYLVKSADCPLNEGDVKAFCSQRLPGFMVPRVVRFERELPKAASGKILKRALPAASI
jgi:long-chain acyl-CoA synthetase